MEIGLYNLFNKARKILYLIYYGMPNRYGHLSREIKNSRSTTIMEIGTWNGEHAKKMIQATLRYNNASDISYYGFDLFEEADSAVINQELSSKIPPPIEQVRNKLESFVKQGVQVHLYKGNTIKMLPSMLPKLPKMDFVFIDGGHSYETVSSDWNCVQQLMEKHTIVIFDDYVNTEALNHGDYGINQVVEEINQSDYSVRLLKPADPIQTGWGILKIQFVKVTPKTQGSV